MLMATDPQSSDKKLAFRHFPRLALEGVIGNAAWAVLLVVAVAIAAKLQGDVPVWVCGVVLMLGLGLSGFLSSALARDRDQMRGERNEARTQAAQAVVRANEIEERADREKRELREQLAAATGGQQVVSTRMQSIARQADALASTDTGYAYGPDPSQVALLVGLLEEFKRLVPANDPVLTQLIETWTTPFREHRDAAWNSALQVLKARALSIGAEEALGQEH
jgi:hypothetical protein